MWPLIDYGPSGGGFLAVGQVVLFGCVWGRALASCISREGSRAISGKPFSRGASLYVRAVFSVSLS